MEVIRNQLTFDKAAQYTDRMTKKTRQRTKDLVSHYVLLSTLYQPNINLRNNFSASFQESQIAQVENEIAQDALNTVTTQARTLTLKSSLEQLEHVIKQKNDIITKSENEGVKRNAIIERKQQIIDQYNKRLEQMISQAGVSTNFMAHNIMWLPTWSKCNSYAYVTISLDPQLMMDVVDKKDSAKTAEHNPQSKTAFKQDKASSQLDTTLSLI